MTISLPQPHVQIPSRMNAFNSWLDLRRKIPYVVGKSFTVVGMWSVRSIAWSVDDLPTTYRQFNLFHITITICSPITTWHSFKPVRKPTLISKLLSGHRPALDNYCGYYRPIPKCGPDCHNGGNQLPYFTQCLHLPLDTWIKGLFATPYVTRRCIIRPTSVTGRRLSLQKEPKSQTHIWILKTCMSRICSWTSLCQTRLSQTPHYLEQNRIYSLGFALVSSVIYYRPRTGLCWTACWWYTASCSSFSPNQPQPSQISWQDVLIAEKCIDVFTVVKAKSDWLDLPLWMEKATSCC